MSNKKVSNKKTFIGHYHHDRGYATYIITANDQKTASEILMQAASEEFEDVRQRRVTIFSPVDPSRILSE